MRSLRYARLLGRSAIQGQAVLVCATIVSSSCLRLQDLHRRKENGVAASSSASIIVAPAIHIVASKKKPCGNIARR